MKKKHEVLVIGVVLAMVFSALAVGMFIGRKVLPPEKDVQKKQTVVSEQETAKEEIREQEELQAAPDKLLIYDIEDGYMQVPYLEDVPKHNYDWNNIQEKKGLKYYRDEAGNTSRIGIDISYFQDSVDWEKVRNAGVDFVILRMGFRGYSEAGNLVVDEKFHQYIREAQAAGLDTGVYFFSQAINEEEAVEEAEFVYRQCKDYELACPVVFDTEKIKGDAARTDMLQPEELTDITIAFCEKIKEHGGEPMIYANAKWLTTKLQLERLTDYPVWYADYQEKPLYPYEFEMWQYTESGQIDGIEGNVDFNIWFPKK